MFVCCERFVLSGRGLCDKLITRPDESYRLWYVVVCDLENLMNEEPYPINVIELNIGDTSLVFFLHAINSDRQTRLLNVLGQIAMILGDKKKLYYTTSGIVTLCRWPSGAHRSATYRAWRYQMPYNTIWRPDDERKSARNM